MVKTLSTQVFCGLLSTSFLFAQEDLGAMWRTALAEAEYYRLVDIPIPPEIPMHPGSFEN